MLYAGGRTHLQTYKLTYTQIFSQYSAISSHSFGRSWGGSMMFLIYPATNFLVDKNSVKYGLHTKIVPQEGYGTRVLTSDACGMR